MARPALRIEVTKKDQNELKRLQSGGVQQARLVLRAMALDESQKQRIIAMVCSDPPEGCARWTVRLVAKEAVKRRLIPRVGREIIRVLLLHHDLNPWREKNVVVRRDKPAWS
jgi:putative transposase